MFCAHLFICALWSPAGKGLTSWLSFVVSSVSLLLSHWYPGSGVVLVCIDSWSLHHYLLSCKPNIYVSWSTFEIRVRLAPLNRFKPSSKIFNWPFQGGTFFCGSFMFFLSCVCYSFVRLCLYVLCGHLLGKGWPLGSRLWCLTVNLSLSHWYPGSGVVLDSIDSWFLHPYLLLLYWRQQKRLTHNHGFPPAMYSLWSYHYGNLGLVTYLGVKVTFSSCSISSFNQR